MLVVDDETAIVDAICEFLDLQNVTTDKANDGEEALKLLATHRYDAIISDIRMPGIDGPKLYEKAGGDGPLLQQPLSLHERRSRPGQHPGFCVLAQLSVPGQARLRSRCFTRTSSRISTTATTAPAPSASGSLPKPPAGGPSASGGLGKPPSKSGGLFRPPGNGLML